MPLNVAKELAALQKLRVGDLRERYTQLFQETTQARNRPWLIKRIIWRMQSLEQGGLSERAIERARELAAISDLRVTAPTQRPHAVTPSCSPLPPGEGLGVRAERPDDVRIPQPAQRVTTKTFACPVASSRTPLPGMLLTRRYKGQLLQVRVLASGFEYLGDRYRSLSAIAKQITGSHCSGNRFFQLTSSTGVH